VLTTAFLYDVYRSSKRACFLFVTFVTFVYHMIVLAFCLTKRIVPYRLPGKFFSLSSKLPCKKRTEKFLAKLSRS